MQLGKKKKKKKKKKKAFWPDYCTYRISKARDSPCAAESSCSWQLNERSLWDLEGGGGEGGGFLEGGSLMKPLSHDVAIPALQILILKACLPAATATATCHLNWISALLNLLEESRIGQGRALYKVRVLRFVPATINARKAPEAFRVPLSSRCSNF